MKEKFELPFFYYRSARPFYILFLPFPVVVFVPAFLMMVKPSFFKSFEPYIFITLGIAFVLFIGGMVAIFIRKLRSQNDVLHILEGKIYLRNKIIDLARVTISFGNFGNSASGARGTVLHIRENSALVRIAVMGFYLDRPYVYDEKWSLETDAFLSIENFKMLLAYLEKVDKKPSQQPIPQEKFLELQLRKPLSPGHTSRLILFVMFPSVILAALLGQISPVLSMLVVLGMVGSFIALIMKANKRDRGYDLTIENEKIILFKAGDKSLFSETRLSDIEITIYQIQIPMRYSRYAYEVLKIVFPSGKEITFGNFLGAKAINRRQSFLEDLKYCFKGPEFLIDEVNFQRLKTALLP